MQAKSAIIAACCLIVTGSLYFTYGRSEIYQLWASTKPAPTRTLPTVSNARMTMAQGSYADLNSIKQSGASEIVTGSPQVLFQQSTPALGMMVAAATAMGAAVGYLLGHYLKPTKVSSGWPSQEISMAAYQAEFAGGMRSSSRLAAAAEDADLKKKIDAFKKEAQDKMDGALEATAAKFNSIRTGRATPALLDRVRVEYYGVLTPLKQMAGISVPDASTILISPFDRTSLGAIEKAIGRSDLGMTPSNDGQVIRIKVPPLTEDRRKEMVKTVAKFGEEGKVAIRNVRRDVLKSADKLDLSENAEADFKDDVQKLTDKFVKKLDELVQAKEKDLTTV